MHKKETVAHDKEKSDAHVSLRICTQGVVESAKQSSTNVHAVSKALKRRTDENSAGYLLGVYYYQV